MIKVLIVDDEVLVRIGIKSAIAWEENGFELVGEAHNGIDALKMIEELDPQILITDIMMPKMNGIELLKEIEKRGNQNIQTIVLSCHNEYEYVREAMKHGAKDYILKLSMLPQELLELLLKIKVSIEDLPKNNLIEKNQMNISMSDLRNQLLTKILNDEFTEKDQLVNILNNLKLDFPLEDFVIIRIHIDYYKNLELEKKATTSVPFKVLVINMINESLLSYEKSAVFEYKIGEYILIKINDSKTEQLCCEVEKSLHNFLNISVSFGISENCESYKMIRTSIAQAEKALEQKFFIGNSSINFYKHTLPIGVQKSLFTMEVENKLSELLCVRDLEKIKILLSELINLIRNTAFSKSMVIDIFKEVFHTYSRIAKSFNGNIYEISFILGKNISDELNAIETLDELQAWFFRFTENFIEYLDEVKLNQCRSEINRIKEYIKLNYSIDFTLDLAASLVNISPNHLSTIFKKETGKNFIDYLTNYRIEKAKELLFNGESLIYEIAEKTGFSNSNYFSKTFKKYTGVTPEEYKKSLS